MFIFVQIHILNILNIFCQKWKNCKKTRQFSLPKRNQFIPDSFELQSNMEKVEIVPKMEKTSLSNVWYLQDSEFHVPMASVSLEIFRWSATFEILRWKSLHTLMFFLFYVFSPAAYQDPLSYLLTELIVDVLESKISDYRYSASFMGLSHSFLYGPYGIYVSGKN